MIVQIVKLVMLLFGLAVVVGICLMAALVIKALIEVLIKRWRRRR